MSVGKTLKKRLRRARARSRPKRTAPVPAQGDVVAPPDFIGVGTMKSGTTWWHSLIEAHPSVVPCFRKEVHYFDRFCDRDFTDADAQRYASRFPRPAGTVTGEWTPRYIFDFWVPPLLRRAAPDAKLLVLLRDPMDRFLSGLAHDEDRHDRRGLMSVQHHFARGLYHEQLRCLLEQFPRSQVLVLQFERCVRDTVVELERTYRFLGLEPFDFVPSLEGERRTGALEKRVFPEHFLASLRDRYRHELRGLFDEFPEIDPELWATTAGLE